MLRLVILFCVAVGTLGAQASAPATTLRFGLLPAESAIPMIVAAEKGFFAARGLKVELTMFQSPLDRNIALQTGKADGAIADVMTALAYREAGLDVVAVSDINEDFKLLASPGSGVTKVADLADKDVSVVPNFALEYVMDKFAAQAGIRWKLVNIPSIPARFEALLANRLTAVVFTEPQATVLAARGAKVLASSKTAGLQVGCQLFTAAYLRDHPDAVRAFVAACDAAVDWMNSQPAASYAPLLTKWTFPDAVASYLDGTKYRHARAIDPAAFADVLAWSKAKKLVTKDARLDQTTSTAYLP